jgi:hypothetical protein
MPAPDLDSSWALALGYAFNHGWQFGKDIVFTYGPYGFLYGKLFDPDYYSLSLGIWLVFAATFGFAVSALLDGARPVGRLLAVAALFVALRSGTWGALYFSDPFFFLVPLTFALIAFDPRRIGIRGLAPALLALSALAGLIKFTYLLFGFTCVVLADLHHLRRRALPWYTVGYLLSVLAFFALAGQKLGNFPAYLRTSLAVTAGYSEAMQKSGATVELLGFAVLALSFLLLVLKHQRASADWKDNRWLGAIPFLAWVAFFFIVFKAAFVRHDPHVEIGWSSAAAAIALYTPRVWWLQSLRAERAALVFLSVVALGVAIARHCRNDHESFGSFLNRNFGSGLFERIDATRKVALGQHRAQQMQRYEAALTVIRARSPMPTTLGTVDAMPWDAAGVIANRLQYHPRPVFESFSAYNQLLMDLNRSFLRSDDAPSLIVFDVAPIDDRFPALDDGALWPELIARYDAQPPGRGPALLMRRALPRRAQLTRIAPDVSAGWGTPVAIPPQAPLVWVMIDVQKNLLGRIVDFLFKLPVIDLSITFEDGTRARRRLVPGIARNGFLLSPVVDSANGFVRLLNRDASLLTALRRVSRIEIDGPTNIAWFYGDSVRVGFEELSFDGPP